MGIRPFKPGPPAGRFGLMWNPCAFYSKAGIGKSMPVAEPLSSGMVGCENCKKSAVGIDAASFAMNAIRKKAKPLQIIAAPTLKFLYRIQNK